MKIDLGYNLVNIQNDVLDAESNPELKFLLEFELQKNMHVKVPFYYDCASSQLFLTTINLTTMKVEKRPFEFGTFSKESFLKMIMKEPIKGMPEWIPDWHSGTFVESYSVKKFMEEKEVEETKNVLQSWWDTHADNVLSTVQANKEDYNQILDSAFSKLKIK